MVPWHSHLVRAERTDAVRQWADLEGKSATTRDDLYQQYVEQPALNQTTPVRGFLLAELIAATLEAWWHSRG